MINFLELKKKIPDKPWLIVGKGPSFNRIYEDDVLPHRYNIFGLNHVGKIIPTYFTSVIDLEVLDSDLISKSQNIIMPWHPHMNFKPAQKGLLDLSHENALLKFLSEEKRLYWYNLSTWKYQPKQPWVPIVQTRYFSAEAAFQILGYLGIKKVYSVGLDGGTEYAKDFYDLNLKPLTNTQPSFDKQFIQIDKTLKKFNMKHIIL